MVEKSAGRIRAALLAILSDAGLFVFVSFIFVSYSDIPAFKWYQEQMSLISRYVLIPWGFALVVQRMLRAQEKRCFAADVAILAVLLAWIIVPFAMRFGATFNNISSWYNSTVVYFGIYAMLREEDPARRARELDRVCALSAAFSFAMGCLLLYTLATRQTLWAETGEVGFGVYQSMLCAGKDYNSTAMALLPLMMLSLVGAARRRHPLARVAHVIPAVLLMICIVLTQSRTSRLAMLIGLAVCIYGAVCTRLQGSAVKRHGVGIVCAMAVLVIGYIGAGYMTRLAVSYYNHFATAKARVRVAVDATFSERTLVWKNLFKLWCEEPSHFLIGNGMGRTGSRIVAGTMHEANGSVAVHNTYLQFIADFGIVGFVLQAAFGAVILRPVLRLFYQRGGKRFAGTHMLSALVIALLAVGMMESAPLGAMTPMNMTLYLALAVLAGEGRLERQGGSMV